MEEIPDEEDFSEKIAAESVAEKVLNHLSPSERELYELKYIAGLSNEDIGKTLGITANAVASRNKRLVEKLKEFYISQNNF